MYPYLLQEVVIYLTKYMQYPPFIYLIQVLIIYPLKVHAELNLYIPAPGIVIIYLAKYMQYSPFIYLLQV